MIGFRVLIAGMVVILTLTSFDSISAPPYPTPTPTSEFEKLDDKIGKEVELWNKQSNESRQQFKDAIRDAFDTVQKARTDALAEKKIFKVSNRSAPVPTPVIILIEPAPTPVPFSGGLIDQLLRWWSGHP